MTENYFKTTIAFLSDYLANQPSDTQYALIWEAMKKYTDELFKDTVEDLIKTFRKTGHTPFPLVYHFELSKQTVEAKKPEIPVYKMIEVKEKLADDEIHEMLKVKRDELLNNEKIIRL
jgi:hypothetical protein